MTTAELNEPPSSRQLLRGTLTALVVAATVLVAVVLPAECGIDPTGIGRGIGLFRPPPAEPEPVAGPIPPVAAPHDAASTDRLLKSQIPFRTDEMSLVLERGRARRSRP